MSEYAYASAFAPAIEEFLAFKAGVGVTGNSMRWHLFDFDRWCVKNNREAFDRDTVEGWVLWRKAKTSAVYVSWMSYIRELGRWMQVNGHPDAYVLSGDFKAKRVYALPYLLSQAEIEGFFDAAAAYRPPSPMAWQAKCLFGLMHSCGLRSCEVIRLRREDVDAAGLAIDIVWSKGHRSRRLAITEEVAEMLCACDRATTDALGAGRSTFFATSTANPLTLSCIGQAFSRIWSAAGLPKERNGKRPRPYDFRHHFAYANIKRWGQEGRDVLAMLPHLAFYMGHSSFDSTYYYIHTSPDFLDGFAADTAAIDDLFPEVGFDG